MSRARVLVAAGTSGRVVIAWWVWGFVAWILLTWTRTVEQLVVGCLVAAVVAAAFAPLGPAASPWLLLDPRRLARLTALLATAVVRIVRANARLTVRIWSPARPLRSGMLVVPTSARRPGELTAVGLTTSLIVDNQLVDLDPHAHRLQYHAVWVTDTDPESNRNRINAPVERYVVPGRD
jgi:multicomponent Na+:H+ antiporter subunit E